MTPDTDTPETRPKSKREDTPEGRGYLRKLRPTRTEGKTEYETWLLTESQAARIIDKFGGPYPTASIIGYDPSQVFRWRYPEAPHPKRGTGGIVPQRALRLLLKRARELGIMLTHKELTPSFYTGAKGIPSRNATEEDLLS